MNEITKDLLERISDFKGSFDGAYNLRVDGACAGRQSSENIRIDRKERGQCRCLGRVLTDKKLPMPIYGAAEKSP